MNPAQPSPVPPITTPLVPIWNDCWAAELIAAVRVMGGDKVVIYFNNPIAGQATATYHCGSDATASEMAETFRRRVDKAKGCG